MTHRLDPLLRPTSVAIPGASARPDTVGEWTLKNLLRGGFEGKVYPVNPRYVELQGHCCYPSLSELPEAPELVVFALADQHIEQMLDEAIAVGAKAAVIMSPLYLEDDGDPVLKERIRKKVLDAGLLVCGSNGMGFYNVRDHVWATGFDSRDHPVPGKISLITHSGSGLCGLIDCDRRLRINVGLSAGSELSVCMDEYLDFVLDLPETRVVGLFIETARNPAGFEAALKKANDKRIPVVALKVGRTQKAAELAVSHSGAMAGDDATYEALFDRYGVQRARDMNELADMLIVFAELEVPGPGGLISLHDSGGERQLMVDLADEMSVPLTELNEQTAENLAAVIDGDLPPVNPLDGWSRGGGAAVGKMKQAMAVMMSDPGAAMGLMVNDRGPDSMVYEDARGYLQAGIDASSKPGFLVASRQGTGADPCAIEATFAGMPVLDGVPSALACVRALFAYRDFLARSADMPPELLTSVEPGTGTLSEQHSLAFLESYGIPVMPHQVVSSIQVAIDAGVDYPAVLKTAVPGILHKSDHNGVVLNIQDEQALRDAAADMQARLGPELLVAPMKTGGVEMFLGVSCDPQFGPVVLVGFGGIHAELLKDVQFALPPFGVEHARRMLDRLKLRPLLNGVRGQPAADINALCETIARFSVMADRCRDTLGEVDVNPLMVFEDGCMAVDALVTGKD